MPSDRIAVIGGGQMGQGLCVQFALVGLDVTLIDHRESNLEGVRERIERAIEFLCREGLADVEPAEIVDDITFTTDLAAGVAGTGVVLETVSEDLGTKHGVFKHAVENAPEEAILATNTSSLRVSDIATGVPDEAHRVVGCHWWNPPYLLAPVEVVRGEETSAETVARTAEFVERAERDPILVERDIPGFVWNRIQFAVLRECAHLVSEGVASIEDVDRAIRDGYARRTAVLGPFETADLAGLELFGTIAEELYPHLADDDGPNELFDGRLAAGQGGVEDGVGFHAYDDPDGVMGRRDEGLARLGRILDTEHTAESKATEEH